MSETLNALYAAARKTPALLAEMTRNGIAAVCDNWHTASAADRQMAEAYLRRCCKENC